MLIYGFYLATFMLVGYWALQRSNGWSVLGLFVVCLFLIWLWFPRFSEAPPDIVLANKESFPELHRLVSLIADSLGSPKPQVLLVEQFTAAYARLGWRRQPHLMLGHSLLSLLDSAELITVIAHELTHERDGSISRHLFVRLAMTAWYRWCRLWWHVANLETLHRAFLPIAHLGAIILLPCLALGRRLNDVANIDRQSGEIYADYRAQQIAQPASITNLFKKIEVAKQVDSVEAAYSQASGSKKYAAIRQAYAAVPDQQQQEIWQQLLERPLPANATHPTIARRLEIRHTVQRVEPTIRFDEEEFGRIQNELKQWPVIMASRERSEATSKRHYGPVLRPSPALLHITAYFHSEDKQA